ncbi:MAG: hypothetical protein KGH57_00405 [Candidatus Micrarchaeota archaeon]|nr:hypothetical protein [Candidatus Micrarchaeota archaeon]
MAKKNNMMQIGGVLTFLGSLIYLYVFFGWYGSAPGAWLNMASFLAPIILGVALFFAVTLFFTSLGTLAGKSQVKMDMAWRFVSTAAIAFVIISGGTGWFYWSVLALLLTFVGAMLSY